jgi:hypothetical protein
MAQQSRYGTPESRKRQQEENKERFSDKPPKVSSGTTVTVKEGSKDGGGSSKTYVGTPQGTIEVTQSSPSAQQPSIAPTPTTSKPTVVYSDKTKGLYVDIDEYNANREKYDIPANKYEQPQRTTIKSIEGTKKQVLSQSRGGKVTVLKEEAAPTRAEKFLEFSSGIKREVEGQAMFLEKRTYGLVDFTSPQGALLTVLPVGKFKVGAVAVKEAGKKVLGTKTGKLIATGAASFLVSEAVQFGGTEVTQLTAPKDVKKLKKQYGEDYLVNQYNVNIDKQIQAQGGFNVPFTDKQINAKSLLMNLPGVTVIPGLRNIFGQEVTTSTAMLEQDLVGRGATPQEAATLAAGIRREQTGREYSNLASFIFGGAVIEEGGRRIFVQRFEELGVQGLKLPGNKASGKLFGEGFKIIAPLGVVEGVTQYSTQQQSREQEISGKGLLVSGAAGGVFAGVLGGSIVATVGRPGPNFALRSLGNLADPTEYPGDLLATGGEKLLTRVTGINIPQPTVIRTINPLDSLSFAPTSPTQTKGKNKAASRETISFPQLNIPTPDIQIFNKPTSQNKKTPTGTPIPITQRTPVPTPSTIPTPLNVFNLQSPTQFNTQTNVNTPFTIFAPVNVASSQLLIPPPIPFTFPNFGSGGGRGNRKIGYVNELAQAAYLFTDSLGVSPLATLSRVSKKPKKEPKAKKQDTYKYDINLPTPILLDTPKGEKKKVKGFDIGKFIFG